MMRPESVTITKCGQCETEMPRWSNFCASCGSPMHESGKPHPLYEAAKELCNADDACTEAIADSDVEARAEDRYEKAWEALRAAVK